MKIDCQITLLPIPTLTVTILDIECRSKLLIVGVITNSCGLDFFPQLGDKFVMYDESTTSEKYRCKINFSLEGVPSPISQFCTQYLNWKSRVAVIFPDLTHAFDAAEIKCSYKQQLEYLEARLERYAAIGPHAFLYNPTHMAILQQKATFLRHELYSKDDPSLTSLSNQDDNHTPRP